MKKTSTVHKLFFIFSLITVVFCQIQTLKAQSKTLPYKCGWDKPSEQAGWTFHQLKSTAYANWGYAGASGSPDYVDHDYPVGNPGTDTVEDWFVSPALNVTGKSQISFSTNVYVIAGSQPTDYFGVWYSKKSADPQTGDFKELANLTSFASTAFTYWHDTAGILLNDSGAAVYIAFKYHETNNWFTVAIDTLEVKAVHNSGIENQDKTSKPEINIYPNPSHGSLSIQLPASIASENVMIEIYDLEGRQLTHTISDGMIINRIDTHMVSPGMYQCKITGKSGEAYVVKMVVD